jgi:Zn-dependent protease with chaperone function
MNALIDVAGWTLVSFVWQGALIAVAAAGVLRLARQAPATVRYAVACGALAAMLVAPALTAWSLWKPVTGIPFVLRQMPELSDRPVAFAPAVPVVDRRPAGPPSARRAGPERWFPLMLAGWLGGVLIITVRTLSGWRRVRHVHRVSLAAAPSHWQAAANRLAVRLGVRRAIHVAECALIEVPAVIGWTRPVIVLPIAALTSLTPAQVDAILAHELAHIRRHDYLVNLLQSAAETLLFYHPAVWWVSAQIRVEREHCCDDVALHVCGAVDYAEALAEIESQRGGHTLALAATGGSLLRRTRRILGGTGRPSSGVAARVAAPALAIVFTVSAAGLAQVVPAVQPPSFVASQPSPPAPPRAPAPPRTPALPRPPVPPAAAQPPAPETSSSREFRTRSHDMLRNLEIRGRGAMTFSDDLTDVVEMADDAYLMIRDRKWFTIRTLDVRGERGRVIRRFYVSGIERPWEPEGRLWLADRLPSLVRSSGLAAESRTRRILAGSGVDGVLDEIALLEGDFARRLYFVELMKAAPLDPTTASRVLAKAGSLIRSDFELRQTLAAATPLVAADATAASAYVDATASIGSDFEHRQALDALLEASGLATSTVDAIARSAATMTSDFEKRQTLSHILRMPGRFGPESGGPVLEAAATIRSDFECATLLIEFAEAQTPEGAFGAPFFLAFGTISSDYERGRVMKVVARRQPLAPEVLKRLFEAVSSMRSDFEKAEVLLAVLKQHAFDAAERGPFIAAADTIRSDFEQGRVFAALVRAERRSL